MRILLLGEYSNVHHTLRDALRRLGHDVLLISDGDGWKDYPRDIDLRRRYDGQLGSLLYVARLMTLLPKMRGYDVVQLINPDVLHLKARWNHWFFDYLKRHNHLVSVGCFGDDYYVIHRSQKEYVESQHDTLSAHSSSSYLEYTDFYANGHSIDHSLNRQRLNGWVNSPKAALTQYVMAKADCLIACLYEYYKVYDTKEFSDRLHYIPLPVNVEGKTSDSKQEEGPLKVLLTVQKRRALMKGTDQMAPVFERLAANYPEKITLQLVESVPFDEYCRLLDEADVIVDQLYSYTPAMNALEAMSRAKVVVSGGEEDYYCFQEQLDPAAPHLRPIINLRPDEPQSNYDRLCEALLDRQHVAFLKQQSLDFVQYFHNADRVAAQYINVWQNILK